MNNKMQNPGQTIVTIKVNEWLYNSLPIETIKVRTEIGTNMAISTEATFTQNESVLLMLNNLDLNQNLFRVVIGGPGKRPVSDRAAVIEELKALGKWKGEDQTGNITDSRTNPEKAQITEKWINRRKNPMLPKNQTELLLSALSGHLQ